MEVYETVDELLKRALSAYEEQFKSQPSCASCAPGRVNLIGEHTDYNDGFVFPMALPLATVIVGGCSSDGICRVFTTAEGVDTPRFLEFKLPSSADDLSPGSPAWANYVKGVVAGFPLLSCLMSFQAVIVSSVPLGGGLSSSASLEVAMFTLLEALVARCAVDHAGGEPEPATKMVVEPMMKARCCQQAEHKYAKMPCGIMDQFVSTMGRAGHAVLIDCRSLEGRQYALSDPDTVVLITNSNVRHELSSSQYPIRRQQCQSAADILHCDKLRDATLHQLEDAKDRLDDVTYRRARHVITENIRCQKAADALQSNDFVTFGQLMVDSHNSLRDDFEVSCEEVDQLVQLATAVTGVYGCRMTGGGFGGCTVALVRADAVNSVIQHVQAHYSGRAQFYVCQAADGARQLQV